MEVHMNYLSLIAAFGAGVFGSMLGGVATFVMVGFIALAGSIAAMAGGADLATACIAFGTVFGPHISFAGAVTAAAYAGKQGYLPTGGADIFTALFGCRKPDVFLVGGLTGAVGYVVQWTYANVFHFNTDTVAMTVATLGILTRLIFGEARLFGDYEGEKRDFFTIKENGLLNNLILGVSVGFIVAGTGMYLLRTFPDQADLITGNYANLFFSISAICFILMMTEAGASTPATHHITITCANATMLSGSFLVGLVVAVAATFLADFFTNNINSHVKSHWDPPAMTIFILSFIIFGIFK